MRLQTIWKRKFKLSTLICCIFILFGFTRANQPNPFSLEFKLINKTGKIFNESSSVKQFCASIKFINKNHTTIEIYPHIQYGFKRDAEFYLEAYDLKGKEVEFGANIDGPDWILTDEKFITFSKGDYICDTICSSLYEFRDKGVFRLRFVFDPDGSPGLIYNGKIISGIIYSNWDTLTIK